MVVLDDVVDIIKHCIELGNENALLALSNSHLAIPRIQRHAYVCKLARYTIDLVLRRRIILTYLRLLLISTPIS